MTKLEHRPIDVQNCDDILNLAFERMEATSIPMSVVIDRLATYAAYLSVVYAGKDRSVVEFNKMAEMIEKGIFDNLGGQRGHG